MKRIKLKFVDFAGSVRNKRRIYYKVLSDHYEVEESECPDYVICAGLGLDHLKYDKCVKILISGENVVPDFGQYDYAIASSYLDFGDRYLRVPYYAFRHEDCQSLTRRTINPSDELLARKFCSFVVSNARHGDPMRKYFFERLSKYKRVDSGGRFMNNIGGAVKDKIGFCAEYKFNIAFENSSTPGYVTEKILDSYLAQSIPIYYGDPCIKNDFREESMVRVRGFDDVERAVDEIVYLDRNDEAYLDRIHEPCIANEVDGGEGYEKRVEDFFANIFSQEKTLAYRRCFFGWQQAEREMNQSVFSCLRRLRNIRGALGGALRAGLSPSQWLRGISRKCYCV